VRIAREAEEGDSRTKHGAGLHKARTRLPPFCGAMRAHRAQKSYRAEAEPPNASRSFRFTASG